MTPPAAPAAARPRTVIATEIVLPDRVPPRGLQVRQRPLPDPVPGQALVRVEATGVSFAEQQMRRGRYPGQPRFPFVPGYDLVGRVEAVGRAADRGLVGARVAAATRTGGWASRVLVPVRDLVAVPHGLDPVDVEALVVNGITAHQLLHRRARVRAGQTVLVHGANGGVGTVLVQLARAAGVRVLGTAAPSHHDALRALGAEPVDRDAPDLPGRVRALAPGGVDAVFDHLGLASARTSFGLLAPGGTLVAYGTAAELDGTTRVGAVFARLLAQLTAWQLLPNGRRAGFYDFWGGSRLRPRAFRRRQHADLGRVLDLLAAGVVTAQVAARFPLTGAAAALELAESRTVRGKVVLLP